MGESKKLNITALAPNTATGCATGNLLQNIQFYRQAMGLDAWFCEQYFLKRHTVQKYVKSTNISSINNKNHQQKCLGYNIPKFSNALSVLDICCLNS